MRFTAPATFLACLISASPCAADSLPEPASTPTATIKNLTSCFTGRFQNLENYLAFTRGKVPPRTAKQLSDDEIRYKYWTTEFECRLFTYEVDGIEVHGFYAKPAATVLQELPVIIYNHGGNADIGWVRPQFIFGKMFPIVKAGFLVIGSQYRGTAIEGVPGPDRLKDEFGGKDVDDVLALLPIIEALPFADASRIGLWGDSRGGMMAFLAARRSKRFSTIAVVGAPTDLVDPALEERDLRYVFETWIPDFDRDPVAALKSRSVAYWAEEIPADVSMLLLHGADDQRVNVSGTLKFAGQLKALGRTYKLVIYEKGSHTLAEHEREVSLELQKWFAQELQREIALVN